MVDFMIMEAVAIKVSKEDEKAAEQAKKKEWQKKERERIKNLVG